MDATEAGAAIQRLEEQNKMLLEQTQAMLKRVQAVEDGRSTIVVCER